MWYPSRWLGALRPAVYAEFGILARHLRFADRATNKLGRALFHAMVRFGPKLERRQMVLFRAVDIGAELFAIAAACVRAQMLAKKGQAGSRATGGRVLPRVARADPARVCRARRTERRRALPAGAGSPAWRARVAGGGHHGSAVAACPRRLTMQDNRSVRESRHTSWRGALGSDSAAPEKHLTTGVTEVTGDTLVQTAL